MTNTQGGGSGTVSMVSGTRLIVTLSVGASPSEPTYDPVDNYVYVDVVGLTGPELSPTIPAIQVISGTSVLANVSLGNNTGATNFNRLAFNSFDHDLYVTGSGANQVAITSGTRIVGTLNVGTGPDALVYDPASNSVYVVNANSVSTDTEAQST